MITLANNNIKAKIFKQLRSYLDKRSEKFANQILLSSRRQALNGNFFRSFVKKDVSYLKIWAKIFAAPEIDTKCFI